MKFVRLTIFAGVTALSPPAFADDWGCEVLLCLSNPKGPTAVTQCVPPITKLWRTLARGHSFPKCDLASSKGEVAQYTPIAADDCPLDQQYLGGDNGTKILCRVRGAVSVTKAGAEVSKFWVNNETAESPTPEQPAAPGGDQIETRILTCAQAAQRSEYRPLMNNPNVTGTAVTDGAVLYENGQVVAVAHGGYADRPIYSGNKLLGYGFVKEIRAVFMYSTGAGASPWRAVQKLNCDISNPDQFTMQAQ